MHTRCPDCHTRYPITAAQLRAGRGEVLCETCNSVFDALAALEQTDPDTRPLLTPKPGQEVRIPTLRGRSDPGSLADTDGDALSGFSLTTESRPRSRTKTQAASRKRGTTRTDPGAHGSPLSGLTLGLLLLLWSQYLFFEGGRLLQNPDLRSHLDRACSVLGCALPPYRDLQAIQTSRAALQKAGAAGDAYEFRLVMSNQSSLPQTFPRLQLILGEIDGKTIAERVFEPSEYLAGKSMENLMATGKSYEIRLLMTAPSRSIGSYRFNMI